MTTNREHYEAHRRDIASRPDRPDRPACHCEIPLTMPGTPDVCGNCAGGISAAPALEDADIFDATNPTGIQQLPSVMTSLTPDAFKSWLAADGELFVVYLPGRRSFIIKVPDVHNAFFVSMMQQVKFALGSDEVQAVRMTVVTGPPPDFDEKGDPIPPADGKADQTPNWARPAAPPTEHIVHDPPPASGPTTTGRARCDGSNEQAVNIRGTDRSFWRGDCPECGWSGKLTYEGTIRAHPTKRADPLTSPLPRGDGPAFA